MLALSPRDLSDLVGKRGDKLFSGLGIHSLRQAFESLGDVKAKVLVHELDKYLEEDVAAECARLAREAGGSLLMMLLQCIDEILKEECGPNTWDLMLVVSKGVAIHLHGGQL